MFVMWSFIDYRVLSNRDYIIVKFKQTDIFWDSQFNDTDILFKGSDFIKWRITITHLPMKQLYQTEHS